MKVLANPDKWLPPVDQVDRPYFIAITGCEENRDQNIFSEYTNFNSLVPVTSSRNNWYENFDQKNLHYFVVKGRFGYYWVDLRSGLVFCAAQHKEGKHPLQHYVMSVEVQGKIMTDEFFPGEDTGFVKPNYKLKHFKVNEVALMNPIKEPVIGGMNTRNITPKEVSKVDQVVFGWEVPNCSVGRVTFEGVVFNRRPRFDLRLLYSLHNNMTSPVTMEFRFVLWDAQEEKELYKIKEMEVNRGETVEWQERIL